MASKYNSKASTRGAASIGPSRSYVSLMSNPKTIKGSKTSRMAPETLLQSRTTFKTNRFPSTDASVRGSDAIMGLLELGSILPSMMDVSGINFHVDKIIPYSAAPTPGGGLGVGRGMNDITKGLEKSSEFKMNDWINIENSGEYLGKKKHFLRIINTLNYDEKILEVSNYMTVGDLVKYYSEYNSNCHNYVWKDIWGEKLHMNKSLSENGLIDRSKLIDEMGLDHFPTILLYFKDGFEDEPPMQLDISMVDEQSLEFPCRSY